MGKFPDGFDKTIDENYEIIAHTGEGTGVRTLVYQHMDTGEVKVEAYYFAHANATNQNKEIRDHYMSRCESHLQPYFTKRQAAKEREEDDDTGVS